MPALLSCCGLPCLTASLAAGNTFVALSATTLAGKLECCPPPPPWGWAEESDPLIITPCLWNHVQMLPDSLDIWVLNLGICILILHPRSADTSANINNGSQACGIHDHVWMLIKSIHTPVPSVAVSFGCSISMVLMPGSFLWKQVPNA